MKIENIRIESIKKYLKQNKITYIQLSERCGIPLGTLRNLFSGFIKNPRLDTIQKIEDALGLRSELVQPYLTEQEEALLQSFRSLSKKGRTFALDFLSNLDRYEN